MYTDKINNILNSLPEVFTQYYQYALKESKTESTSLSYLNRINAFYQTLENNNGYVDLGKIEPIQLEEYINDLDVSNSEKATVWSALNSFFSYLEDYFYIYKNPMLKVKRARTKGLSLDKENDCTCSLLYELTKTIYNSKKGMKWRDLAILLLITNCGLKTGSIVSINLNDYDSENSTIFVGDIDIKVCGNTKKYLEKWLEYRSDKYSNIDNDAMFISQVKNRISTDALRDLFASYGTIYTNITVEDIRRTVTKGLLNIGVPVESIQKYLQHKDKIQTYAYLDSIQNQADNSREEDEDAILNMHGYDEVSSVIDVLNGEEPDMYDFTKEVELKSASGYTTGTTVKEIKPSDFRSNEFDEKWFNISKADIFCKLETKNREMVWFSFDQYEKMGYYFSPIICHDDYDVNDIEDRRIYIAQFDLNRYFSIDEIDENLLPSNIDYFFAYLTGYIDYERVNIFRIIAKAKDEKEIVVGCGEQVCSCEQSYLYEDRILDNINFFANKLEKISESETSKEDAVIIQRYIRYQKSLFSFLRSFKGAETLFTSLEDGFDLLYDKLSSLITLCDLKELKNTLDNMKINSNNDISAPVYVLDSEELIYEDDNYKVELCKIELIEDKTILSFNVINNTDENIFVSFKEVEFSGEGNGFYNVTERIGPQLNKKVQIVLYDAVDIDDLDIEELNVSFELDICDEYYYSQIDCDTYEIDIDFELNEMSVSGAKKDVYLSTSHLNVKFVDTSDFKVKITQIDYHTGYLNITFDIENDSDNEVDLVADLLCLDGEEITTDHHITYVDSETSETGVLTIEGIYENEHTITMNVAIVNNIDGDDVLCMSRLIDIKLDLEEYNAKVFWSSDSSYGEFNYDLILHDEESVDEFPIKIHELSSYEMDNFNSLVANYLIFNIGWSALRYMANKPDPIHYHHTLGLYIRNEFLYPQTYLFRYYKSSGINTYIDALQFNFANYLFNNADTISQDIIKELIDRIT